MENIVKSKFFFLFIYLSLFLNRKSWPQAALHLSTEFEPIYTYITNTDASLDSSLSARTRRGLDLQWKDWIDAWFFRHIVSKNIWKNGGISQFQFDLDGVGGGFRRYKLL